MSGAEDERELIERLQRKEERAFAELVRRYEEQVFRVVFRMVGDRAESEDISQEVFVTVFRSIDGFRGESKLSTWIYRVAANHCSNRIKYHRRRARDRRMPFDDAAEKIGEGGLSAHIPGPEAVVEGRQTEALVQRALLTLSDEHRTLVVLRDVEGMRYDEIMIITGLAEGTLKSKLHRARLALAKALRSKEGGR